MSPAEAAALIMSDPAEADETRATATVLGAEALAYLTHPDRFGKFRLSCLESYPGDRDWLADMQPEVLATFAEVLAPTGGGQ
jgi:hypothetical protein